MPARSLSKVQKHINKKKGLTNSLHENSRDAQRLRRAAARDDKLSRLQSARAKSNQTFVQRIAHFQQAANGVEGPMDVDKVKNRIQEYLLRDDEELQQLKKERRPGRPSSTREDMLKQRIAAEQKEYESGFWVPDMADEGNIARLRNWDGNWGSLGLVKFVRVSRNGVIHPSSFPPKGNS